MISSSWLKPLLLPLSWIYSVLALVKNAAYDYGLLDGVKVDSKVISVGNLTMGGTGKTPIVDLILTHFEQKNLSTSLIARNYKAQVQHTVRVDTTVAKGGAYFGDEAWMLAVKHPMTKVFVGPQKWYSLWLASRSNVSKISVVDDGFQHRQLHRDLDIVVIDSTADENEYNLIPLGRARESWSSLQRSQLVVLTKTNWAKPDRLDQLRAKVKSINPTLTIAEAASTIQTSEFAGKRVLAFAGIGRPEQFRRMLESSTEIILSQFLAFDDHQKYGPSEIHKIQLAAADADVILTTEKDFAKLNPQDFTIPLISINLRTEIVAGASEFYAALDSCIC